MLNPMAHSAGKVTKVEPCEKGGTVKVEMEILLPETGDGNAYYPDFCKAGDKMLLVNATMINQER